MRPQNTRPQCRRYLWVFALVALIPVMVVISANCVGFILQRQTPGSDVLNRQIRKLEHSQPIDLVLLGDSTLQAAVDEALLSRLTGQTAQNLALSGVWGYAGSLALLERVLERQQEAPVVLLFHTSDTLGRDTSDFGFLLASHHPSTTLLADPDIIRAVRDNLTSAKNFKKWFRAWRRSWFTDARSTPPPEQKASIRDEVFNMADFGPFIRENLNIKAINDGKLKYLRRLATLCKIRHLQCLYAHGPIARPFLQDIRQFHEAANPIIEGLGFNLLRTTPLAIDYADLGDTEDHVAPASREIFTRRFADLLRPYLNPAPKPADRIAERPI